MLLIRLIAIHRVFFCCEYVPDLNLFNSSIMDLGFRIFFLIFGLLLFFVGTPYAAFYTWKAWTRRRHTALAKRRIKISFYEILSVYAFLLMEIWWILMLSDFIPFFEVNLTTEFLNWIFWSLSLNCVIWISVLKFWLSYYDMRWLIASHRKQWHQIINPKSIVQENDSEHETRSHKSLLFYLRHKRSLGSFRYTWPFAVIIAIFFSLLQVCFAF